MAHNGHEPGAAAYLVASGQSDDDRAAWLAAIVTGLAPGGLDAELHDTPDRLDLTATFHWPGHKDIDVTVDEDGHAGLHWQGEAGAPPADVATAIICAIAGYRPGRPLTAP